MRHLKKSSKFSRTASHRRCMWANMLKALIIHEKIETTVKKAKELRSHADKMVTLAKRDTLHTRRQAISKLMIRYNPLTPKEARAAKNGDTSSYNDDRLVIGKLFSEIKDKFTERNGGYTRIVRTKVRKGDSTEMCIISFVE